MKYYIYDLETYPNFFLATFKLVGQDRWYEFEISDRKSDLKALKNFLSQKNITLIGFNNLNFDYPVLHNTILSFSRDWQAEAIYSQVEEIIAAEYSAIAPWHVRIPQIDLFKIWHYDNKNKRTSLKWIEFALRMENVEDLPYAIGSHLSHDQKDKTILYCRNDINATEAFYLLSEKHISLREFYTGLEGIDLINASEIRMSKEIFAKKLASTMEMEVRDVKALRTYRNKVPIKDVIFDYISFNDPINQSTLEEFNNRVWKSPDIKTDNNAVRFSALARSVNSIKFSRAYKNVVREYAEGGLHSFGKPGVYESNDDYVLVDVDFASYYPHLSFKNKLHPSHIPESVFNEIYEGFYHERKKYPKSDPRNYVLKIILNGSYGLSKDKYSFLYDPKWQLAICINGQLLLTKLTELIYENCKEPVQIIFENTDGAMYLVHRKDLDAVRESCREMEAICQIPLETQQCDKIIIRDVNNYINIISDDNIKFKGCFEIDRDYHKNHSKRIVPLALANYFCNNVAPSNTINNHIIYNNDYKFGKNYGIYDFCLGAKMKGDNALYKRDISSSKVIDTPLSKMTRYYVSEQGYQLIKKLPPLEKSYMDYLEKYKRNVDASQLSLLDLIDDTTKVEPKMRETNIEAGWWGTIFNKYEKKQDYKIKSSYYIEECEKIIRIVEATSS